MRLSRTLALGASMLVLLSACSTGGGGSGKPTIKIGSDGFDEARVVAEAYAQVLEGAGYTVDRAGIGLGTRKVTAAALESGEIELKPEYIGSGLVFYGGAASNDPAKNQTELQAKLTSVGGGVTVFNYTPGQDTNALVVTKETADANNLETWGDLAAVAGDLKWGLATDCPTNPVCAGALKDSYGIDIETIDVTLLDACSTPMADALKAGTIDVAELCSTGPEIIVNDWVRLEDDKKTQPADAIAPIVRNDLLAKVGDKAAFQKLLDDVSAKIDTATLADLYKQVSVDKKDTKDVASTWLKAQGLIK
jgi:osmoprotectant transport system substrate-binding protein